MTHLNSKRALPWLIYLMFLAVLNETVFGVSLPAIKQEFQLSSTGVSWMSTMFILFFGVCTVIFGRLSDLYSVHQLLSIGIILYALGSILGFLGHSQYSFILTGRALQGMGGSALPALIMVIIVRYFDAEERGALFGSIGSVASFAAGIGPVLGGFVAGHTHWSWLFLIPLLTLFALPPVLKILPKEPTKAGKIDFWGATSLVVGLSALIVFLTYPEWYWITLALGFIGTFVIWIQKNPDPFVDPKLFRIKPYRAAVIMVFVLFGIFIGIQFLLPLMLTHLYQLDAQTIGLVLFPGALSGVFLGPWCGKMADQKGNFFVFKIGITLLSVSLMLSVFMQWLPLWGISMHLIFVFAGFTFANTGLINGVSQILPPEETGVGMGVFNLVGFLAGAVGAALVGRTIDAQIMSELMLLGLMGVILLIVGMWYLNEIRIKKLKPAE